MAAVSSFNGLLFGVDLLFIRMAVLLYVAIAGDSLRRVIAAQGIGLIASLDLGLLSIAFATPSFGDLAIAMALLSIGAGLAYAHFLERWL